MIIKIIFFWLCLLIDCDAEPLSGLREKVLETLKAEISQKITATDFQISLDNWMESWGKEEAINNATPTLTNVTINADQRHFSASMVLGKNPARRLIGKIEWMVDIPVLKTPVNPGHIISEADLTWQRFPADNITGNMVTKKEGLIGKTSKNTSLKLGIPVNSSDLQAPVVVTKGSAVQISYHSPLMIVTSIGAAQSNASVGDVIFFEVNSLSQENTTSSKKLIQAKVTGPNQAEVMGSHS